MALPNLSNLPVLKKNLPLIVAGISALLAVVLINFYLQQQAEAEKRRLAELQKNYVKVIVAAEDLPVGAIITEELIGEESMHKSKIPENATGSVASVLNRVVTVPLRKGEPIQLDRLGKTAKRERAPTLSEIIPPGKRAVSINMDGLTSVGGMISPGDHVDVVGVISLPTEKATSTVSLTATKLNEDRIVGAVTVLPLFQDVLILAVEQQVNPIPVGKGPAVGTATLALSPQEANILAFISEHGHIRLLLRSVKDKVTQPTNLADWDSVLKVLLPQESKKPPKTVEIYRGLKREEKFLE
jgi:pilus assembly protein CpaB